jgi:hypothetical protein
MFPPECAPSRRNFLKIAGFAVAGSGLMLRPEATVSDDADMNVVGPRKGYSPQIG